jgi:hypothetical protein
MPNPGIVLGRGATFVHLTGAPLADAGVLMRRSGCGAVAGQAAALLRPGGHLVLNAANIRTGATMTPLAWDLAAELSRHLRLVRETVRYWDRPPADITGDYLLVYQRN